MSLVSTPAARPKRRKNKMTDGPTKFKLYQFAFTIRSIIGTFNQFLHCSELQDCLDRTKNLNTKTRGEVML